MKLIREIQSQQGFIQTQGRILKKRSRQNLLFGTF